MLAPILATSYPYSTAALFAAAPRLIGTVGTA